jgi:hypothetical protein
MSLRYSTRVSTQMNSVQRQQRKLRSLLLCHLDHTENIVPLFIVASVAVAARFPNNGRCLQIYYSVTGCRVVAFLVLVAKHRVYVSHNYELKFCCLLVVWNQPVKITED